MSKDAAGLPRAEVPGGRRAGPARGRRHAAGLLRRFASRVPDWSVPPAGPSAHGAGKPSDRTRGNGHKLKQRKLQLNPRKNFFPLRVTEPWPRLPRGAVDSPSLEIFKPRLDAVLCSLLWVTLLGQGVGLGDPQRALPTPTIL